MQLTEEEFEHLGLGILFYILLGFVGGAWYFFTSGAVWTALTGPETFPLGVALLVGFYCICLFGATVLTFGTLVIAWLRTVVTVVEE